MADNWIAILALLPFLTAASWFEPRLPRPPHVDFDERLADRAVDLFEKHLCHTKGEWAGKPFALPEFQKTDIREIFGRVDRHGNRLISEVFMGVPKKNGKSELAAGAAIKLAYADSEPGAEVYCGASDKDQAGRVFGVAMSMVRRNPMLRSRSKILAARKRIEIPLTESILEAVSSDVAGKHGYNSSGVVFDEVHTQKDDELWNALTFGVGNARRQPLKWAITTAGIVGESPVAESLFFDAEQILRGIQPCPDHFYPILYQAPEDADWTHEETWKRCNPAWGLFLKPKAVRQDFEDCIRRKRENVFRRLRLNQWPTATTRWIDPALWARGEEPFDWRQLRDWPCYVGLDLSSRLDLCARVCVWLGEDGTFYLWPKCWIPRDTLNDRPKRESAKYQTWAASEDLEIVDGGQVDLSEVERDIVNLREELNINVAEVVVDPMFAQQLGQNLQREGFVVVEMRQTTRNYTEPMLTFEAGLVDKRIRHGGHPVLRFAADCVEAKTMANGEMMPVKPDRRKSGKRIDPIVAALMGVSRAGRHFVDQSRFDEPGVIYL